MSVVEQKLLLFLKTVILIMEIRWVYLLNPFSYFSKNQFSNLNVKNLRIEVMIMMAINCFCEMVDQRKTLSCLSTRKQFRVFCFSVTFYIIGFYSWLTLRLLIQSNVKSRIVVRSQLGPSIQSVFSDCAGIQLVTHPLTN